MLQEGQRSFYKMCQAHIKIWEMGLPCIYEAFLRCVSECVRRACIVLWRVSPPGSSSAIDTRTVSCIERCGRHLSATRNRKCVSTTQKNPQILIREIHNLALTNLPHTKRFSGIPTFTNWSWVSNSLAQPDQWQLVSTKSGSSLRSVIMSRSQVEELAAKTDDPFFWRCPSGLSSSLSSFIVEDTTSEEEGRFCCIFSRGW